MIKRILFASAATVAACLPLQPAFGWSHSGSWSGAGGRTFNSSSSGTWGHGWSASGSGSGGRSYSANGNAYGWHGSGSNGGQAWGNYHGWAGVGPNDHWATGTRYGAPAAGGYYGYHPPAVVNHYYGGAGCYNCGGWGTAAAGAAVGLAAGAAIGSAAAASAAAPAVVYYPGAVYPVLPPGCAYVPYGGMTYYRCNGAYFRAAYGANGTYYTVVPAP